MFAPMSGQQSGSGSNRRPFLGAWRTNKHRLMLETRGPVTARTERRGTRRPQRLGEAIGADAGVSRRSVYLDDGTIADDDEYSPTGRGPRAPRWAPRSPSPGLRRTVHLSGRNSAR